MRTPLVLTGREKPGLTSWATELLGSGELGVQRLVGRWWGERKGAGHGEGPMDLGGGGSWLLPPLARIQIWAPGAGRGGTWETPKAAGVFGSWNLGIFYW